MKPFRLAPIILLCLASLAVSAQLPIHNSVDGHVATSRHLVYNNRGMLAVAIEYTYNNTGIVQFRTLSSYDSHGRVTRRQQFTDTDFLLVDETFKYDKYGNLVRRTTLYYEETGEKDKQVERRKYTYDSNGFITHRTYYLNDQVYFDE